MENAASGHIVTLIYMLFSLGLMLMITKFETSQFQAILNAHDHALHVLNIDAGQEISPTGVVK